VVFDSDPAAVGRTVGGIPVRPVTDIAAVPMCAIVLSSLAFQDEMAARVESLAPGLPIVRCYS